MALSSSSTAGRSPSASNRADKNKKQGKIIILKLSPKLLRQFEEPTAKPEEQSTASVGSSPTPPDEDASTLKVPEANDNASESNSTPAPTPADPAAADGSRKKKGGAGGAKRSLGQMMESNGTPKPRGKPGPKKKPRLYVPFLPLSQHDATFAGSVLTQPREDGSIDHGANKGSVTTGPGPGGHKLGPKANQGAINAGLRALDRSGKPCRKWVKKSFTLKSFTGVTWELPSWKGHERPGQVNGEESSETKDISLQSSSDVKPNESDAAMDSNAGDQPDPMALSTPAASSPPPIPPQSSAIAAHG
ncbi:hypothetical protein HRR86_003708 [Exophiala dermatitidis]|nr:hypothetical protein HRR82_003612 [Exophiala dermatitidis]KAJ4603794.1 hypothetical protein HRR85_008354 [Exophiala dermatitidis]KAJ4627503.1 hypothetical protein HRR86_003708 [Exophiala dermatitidis]